MGYYLITYESTHMAKQAQKTLEEKLKELENRGVLFLAIYVHVRRKANLVLLEMTAAGNALKGSLKKFIPPEGLRWIEDA